MRESVTKNNLTLNQCHIYTLTEECTKLCEFCCCCCFALFVCLLGVGVISTRWILSQHGGFHSREPKPNLFE